MSNEPRRRRNIDDLSSEELSDYIFAIEAVRNISAKDPESVDGYTYFEQLHDGDKGPCEHANDTFLPWHRGQLWLFEEALRRSKPPRTSNVTIPYWDWSALPSGVRYPAAFEDEKSPLFNLRNTATICRQPGDPQCQNIPFPRWYLEETVLTQPNWSSPVPGNQEAPEPSFGGVAGGESDCTSPFGKGFGVLEQPAHNDMHGTFIGGDMGDPSSAALDPIFWSFHAYIDLLWWQWQRMPNHMVDTGLTSRLCGLYKDSNHAPDNRYRVQDVLRTEDQLGYTYDYVRRDAPRVPLPPDAVFASHPARDFVLSGTHPSEVVRTLDFRVPQAGFRSAQFVFEDMKVHTPFSYSADIYLAPTAEPFRPRDADYRARYLVDLLFMWRAHAHHGHQHGHGGPVPTLSVAVDARRAIQALAQQRAGEAWTVVVALTAQAETARPMAARSMATDVNAAPVPSSAIDFGALNLRIV